MRLPTFIVLAILPVLGPAQGPVPQTYSFTEDPGFPLAGPNVVKVVRDGSKETIEQTMPPGGGRDKEYHSRRLYDFQAHKIYLKILSDPTMACGVQDISENAAPGELDPIGGGDALLKELTGTGQLKEIGKEIINGIATRVMNADSAEGKGKIWLAQNGGYPVKVVAIGPDGKEQTIIEMKQLSLAKPPASAFAIPADCAATPADAPPKPSTNVTKLTLQPIPNYTGACPAHIKMTGTITVDGPGTVFYQFGAGNMEPGEIIKFDAAGTKTVTHVMTFQPKYGDTMGGGAISRSHRRGRCRQARGPHTGIEQLRFQHHLYDGKIAVRNTTAFSAPRPQR